MAQVLLLTTNLSPAAKQAEWFERFEAQRARRGLERSGHCCVCLDALAPGSEPKSRVYITTCHHVLHVHCWEAHRAAHEPGVTVGCPECRHEIIVPTAPTLVMPGTGEAVPLRPGRESADLADAIARGGAGGSGLRGAELLLAAGEYSVEP